MGRARCSTIVQHEVSDVSAACLICYLARSDFLLLGIGLTFLAVCAGPLPFLPAFDFTFLKPYGILILFNIYNTVTGFW